MKKRLTAVIISLILALTITVTVFATKPEYVEGFVPIWSVGWDEEHFWYDVCDPVLVGHVIQPAVYPGKTAHGVFIMENKDFCSSINTTDQEGTCQITIIPVEAYGNPDSKPGRAVIGQCTGDLAGLHGTILIDYLYGYQAWYHFDP